MTEITAADVASAHEAARDLEVRRALQQLLENDILQEDSYDLLTRLVFENEDGEADAVRELIAQLDSVAGHLETVSAAATSALWRPSLAAARQAMERLTQRR